MKKPTKRTAQDVELQHRLATALRAIAKAVTPEHVASPQLLADIADTLVWLPAETLQAIDVIVKHQMEAMPADIRAAARGSRVRHRREYAADVRHYKAETRARARSERKREAAHV